MKRSSGTLMHITSLPSPYGIGTMGAEAYRFARFLKRCGQRYWQILPLGPTGYGDSPYQCFSTYAGNPYLIDLDMLQEEGLLKKKEYAKRDWGNPKYVDYGKLYEQRFDVLRIAAERANPAGNRRFVSFCEKNAEWLFDYAVFMAIKQENGGKAWTEWKQKGLMLYDQKEVAEFAKKHAEEVRFWMFVQYLFFQQWHKLKKYVNKLGIKIIGDIPIYVAADSADVWAQREQYLFDSGACGFTCYAGCPPDAYCADGQFWGNPIYDWEHMMKDDYAWWAGRIRHMESMFDMIRIDHFRGFEAYYSIDAGEETARTGQWHKGPGMEFFGALKKELGDYPIIAEDLGFLTPEVHELRDKTGYPGMKVLQFAFEAGADNPYLPHNFDRNCVVYTGTHDNETVEGWFANMRKKDVGFAVEYAALTKKEGYNWGMIRLMYGSVAGLAIAQMQDYLNAGAEARMNTPSTLGGNWKWRVGKNYDSPELIRKIRRMVKLYGR